MRKVALLALVAALACEAGPLDPSSGTDAAALTVTDSAEYVLSGVANEAIQIRAIFSNRTSATVWIIRCEGPWPEVEKLVRQEWVRVSTGGRTACLGSYPVEAGAQLRVDDYRLDLDPSLLAVDSVPGTYRLIWPQMVWNFETQTETSSFGDLLPLEYRISNQFALKAAPASAN